MTHDLGNTNIRQAPSASSRWLPVVFAASMPLLFGIWWWASPPEESGESPASPTIEDAAQDTPPAESAAPDPWRDIDHTIYPRGRIETVHQADEFTFLLIRGHDADRWIVTQRIELNRGDIVQFEVAPRSIKEDFKSKALGRVFPSIVLVGQDRVKVIQAAKSGDTEN